MNAAITVAAKTHCGRVRPINEDSYLVPEGDSLALVADGMGGHKAGDFASRFVVDTMVRCMGLYKSDSPVTALRKAIEKTNELLFLEAQRDPDREGMGSTLVAATVDQDTMYVANVGDSRLYVINREEIRQVTRDHSLVEEMVRMGEIPREEARFHPDKNVITRAIGAEYDVKIDFFGHKLRENDKILLCSDGLTNMLEDDEIFDIVNRPEELSRRAGELINRANTYGGKDNISVILVEPFEEEVKACC